MKIINKKITKRKIKKPITIIWLAEVGYAETAGLYPQKSVDAGPKASIYDKKTWNQNSFTDLQAGRTNIMSVAQRNSGVHTVAPGKGKIEQQAWKFNLDAAKFSIQCPLSGNFFFIRQDGVGAQKPPDGARFGKGSPLVSYGPFRNVGGGDAPKGNKTYIDIYTR